MNWENEGKKAQRHKGTKAEGKDTEAEVSNTVRLVDYQL